MKSSKYPKILLNQDTFLVIFAKQYTGMQFKHPEILWALLLLLIPIIVHLFQLRRFKKTPFTNVKMLQKVVAESQKSKSIKKWFLLFTRLLLFTALILAFAQAFFANKKALQEKETVIYVDNSFSMQAKNGNTSLLENAVQELLKNVPQDQKINLFTNDKTFANTRLKTIQNEVLTIEFSSQQLLLNEIELKAATLFSKNENTIKNLVVISDFQNFKIKDTLLGNSDIQLHLIQQKANEVSNIAIDSIYVSQETEQNMELNAVLSSTEDIENAPISVFNEDQLIAKTSAVFDKNKKTIVTFSLPANETILGKITLTDNGLEYDNQFYFSLNKKDNIKVLVVSNEDANFLKRIFTEDEFDLTITKLNNLNYSIIENHNLIILNDLETIPESLQQALLSFSKNNGTITIIPSQNSNVASYNFFLGNFNTSLTQRFNSIQEITTINFNHPLFTNVFENKVTNFQYPKTTYFWQLKTKASNILSYADGKPFLVGEKGFYLFTASLYGGNTFKNSPLIVPTFYKMGLESLQREQLYKAIGTKNNLDISVQLPKDAILKIAKKDFEFIPQQQPYANKVVLSFTENPKEDGNYEVKKEKNILKHISFNYPRTESRLEFTTIDNFKASSKQASISNLFETLQKDDRIRELWKWFVILALVFALIEIGIQKYLK